MLNKHNQQYIGNLTDQEVIRKQKVKEVLRWELDMQLDGHPQATGSDLMAMDVDEFAQYFEKVGSAYRRWNNAKFVSDDFKKFLHAEQQKFGNPTKPNSSVDESVGHEMNLNVEDLLYDSNEEHDFDWNQSDSGDSHDGSDDVVEEELVSDEEIAETSGGCKVSIP